MTDHDLPRDGERLSAYLAGELGETDAAELELRLARDPDLAADLEDMRALLEGLARLDDVEPPPGFADRLEARLAQERAGGAAPASLDVARVRRDERRRRRWPALGAVAAGVAGVALIGAVALGGFGTSPQEDAEVAEAPADEDAPMDMMEAPEADDDSAAGADAAPEAGRARREPLVRDTGVVLDDADAVRAALTGGPAEDLLGISIEEATDLADAFAVAVRRADSFASGDAPGACLDVVTAGTDRPVVVAQVESARHDDASALAYVTAGASADSTTLDRVEAWVLTAEDCATRLFVDLTPSP